MKHGDKTKLRILNAANDLFYHKGFVSTSIQDMVDITGLSKGNITYHFSSKQSIFEGVIALRVVQIEQMLASWDEEVPSVELRLQRFCEMLGYEKDRIVLYGCPMGTLTSELSKNAPDLYQISLPMFECFQAWLTQQFELLEYPPEAASKKSMAALARVQGIALVSHVFRNTRFLQREIDHFKVSAFFERYVAED